MSMGEHQCYCGCNHFRFKRIVTEEPLSVNQCSNCNHMLLEHTKYTRKQAE